MQAVYESVKPCHITADCQRHQRVGHTFRRFVSFCIGDDNIWKHRVDEGRESRPAPKLKSAFDGGCKICQELQLQSDISLMGVSTVAPPL